MTGQYEFRIQSSMSEAGRDAWQALFRDAAQGYDYYRACELAPPDAFRFYAAGVFENGELIAGTPMFRVSFRLDMVMSGGLQSIGAWLNRKLPKLTSVPIVGAGSPHADELSLVFASRLDEEQRGQALEALIEGIHRHAAASGAHVVVVKSVLDHADQWSRPHFEKLGYSRVASLPVARLAFADTPEAYIESLSANMRSNMRRKLKRARDVRTEIRDSVDGLEQQINQLRELTRARGKADYDVFEELSPAYFRRVLEQVGPRARLLTYWRCDALIGFALVLIERDCVIEKYTGLRYPDAIDNGVFFLNWMNLVVLGIENGVRQLNAGETTYLTKARLGCRFERSWIYLRHRWGVMSPVMTAIAPLLALDKTDPDLKLLGRDAPYM